MSASSGDSIGNLLATAHFGRNSDCGELVNFVFMENNQFNGGIPRRLRQLRGRFVMRYNSFNGTTSSTVQISRDTVSEGRFNSWLSGIRVLPQLYRCTDRLQEGCSLGF